MENNKTGKHETGGKNAGRVALIPLQAGCLTFGLATVAILVGLWLDVRLGTTPRWMLILLVGSAPFVLGGVFLIVRRSLRRIQDQREEIGADEEK